jgi:dihydropyrimidinase
MSAFRIHGGRVVTTDGTREMDVVVADGAIVAVEPPAGDGDLDARGCFILPGGVDPHSHLLADIEPASVSALRGGTTTALTFTAPRPGETPAAAYRRALDEDVPRAAIEIGLHPSIWEPDSLAAADRDELAALGACTIKHFLGYPELGMMTSDRTLYESLRHGSEVGLLTLVHCENGAAIDARVDEAIARGRTDMRAFVWARHPGLEEEAVARTIALAGVAGAPVYLVHVSTAGSLDLVRQARARGQQVWAEACTHHLLLDESVYDRPDAERFLVVPPLRSHRDVDALWRAVADGTIDTIGSDHAQAAFHPPFPPDDFRGLPYRAPRTAHAVGRHAPRRVARASRRRARHRAGQDLRSPAAQGCDRPRRRCRPRAVGHGVELDGACRRAARRARRLTVRRSPCRRSDPSGAARGPNRVGAWRSASASSAQAG